MKTISINTPTGVLHMNVPEYTRQITISCCGDYNQFGENQRKQYCLTHFIAIDEAGLLFEQTTTTTQSPQ